MAIPPKVVFVDIDGTIFKHLTNTPIKYARDALWTLKKLEGAKIIYVTGRPYDPTEAILENGFPLDHVFYKGLGHKPFSIFTPTVVMKQHVVDLFKGMGIKPIEAFDNEKDMVDMYRRNGIRTTQVTGPETWAKVLQRYF